MNAFPKRQLHDLAIFGGPKAFKEKLHVGAPNVGNRESLLQRIEAILGTRWLTNNGPYVQEFEKLLAEKTGVKHCLAICNGTIALEIAIRALDLSGEVIVPSFTFVSTAHALQWHGIKPVFCDIDPRTHNIDPCQIESLITERTSGIMAVLREKGLVLVTSDGERLPATGATVCDLKDALPQDLVVLAVKAYDLPAVAVDLPRICHEDTIVLPMQNGLPWWYFQCHPEPWSGRRIECLDPDGSLARSIPPERILGSVVYPAAEVVEPGIVRHVEGHRIVVGELDDRETDRAATIIEMLNGAGFKSFFLEDLRGEVWLKLLGTAVFNPVSALARSTMVEMCQAGASREVVVALMQEVEAVANAFGVTLRLPIERRLAGAEKVGGHKTSTLQDLESGRRLEVDALVGAVVEIARWANVPTPRLEVVDGIVRLLDRASR